MNPYWVAVYNDVGCDFNKPKVSRHKTIEDLCKFHCNAKLILIDIPIGLPYVDKNQVQVRPDNEAKNYLISQRKSSIFNVLPREIVYANTKEEAWNKSRELGQKMTPVAEALRKLIREVDEFLRQNTVLQEKIMESHPEVAFSILSKGNPPLNSKKTAEGILERKKILDNLGFCTSDINNYIKSSETIDVLDAYALYACAKLGDIYGYKTIPSQPHVDEYGLKMQMIFASLK